jgi:hypothetical protein
MKNNKTVPLNTAITKAGYKVQYKYSKNPIMFQKARPSISYDLRPCQDVVYKILDKYPFLYSDAQYDAETFYYQARLFPIEEFLTEKELVIFENSEKEYIKKKQTTNNKQRIEVNKILQ